MEHLRNELKAHCTFEERAEKCAQLCGEILVGFSSYKAMKSISNMFDIGLTLLRGRLSPKLCCTCEQSKLLPKAFAQLLPHVCSRLGKARQISIVPQFISYQINHAYTWPTVANYVLYNIFIASVVHEPPTVFVLIFM